MSNSPHYHGHRQRLRERLRRDPSALYEYEVLELLLGGEDRGGQANRFARMKLPELASFAQEHAKKRKDHGIA